MLSYIRRILSLDLRSVALMRMGVAIIIIIDLIARSRSLIVHYTDAGALPRSSLLTLWQNKFFISLHMASGTATFEAILFIIAGVFALMLLFGYRTRLAAVISWLLLISLHARNPIILQGGDVVFRVIFFWMLFLPLGARYSLDNFFGRLKRTYANPYFSAATVAYIAQVMLIYIFSAITKTGYAWHEGGDAVYYALSLDQLVTSLGLWINSFPPLTTFLTHATLLVEMWASFLFISPIKNGWARIIGVVVLAGMQIGFNVSLHLGLFGPIMIVITLGLLPAEFWEKIVRPIYRKIASWGKQGITIYFDNDCSFCARVVRVLKKVLFLHPTTPLLSAETDPSIREKMERMDSWVVLDRNGVAHFGFDAFVLILSHSALFSWASRIAGSRFSRRNGEVWYRTVAKRRMAICLPPKTLSETPRQKNNKKLVAVGIYFLLGYSLLWNIDTLPGKNMLSEKFEWIGWTTRLDQKFAMFAPTPLLEDGWYVIAGTMEDGRTVDLFRDGQSVTYEKPNNVAKLYMDQRWQKYMMNLWDRSFAPYRSPYIKYLCTEWNDSHDKEERVKSVQMFFMLEKTPPRGYPTEVKQMSLLTQACQ